MMGEERHELQQWSSGQDAYMRVPWKPITAVHVCLGGDGGGGADQGCSSTIPITNPV